MAKKRVPDWLNSSLWSSPQPPFSSPPPPPHNTVAIAEPSVPISPPAVQRPPEPPASSVNSHATKGETRDPLRGNSGNNNSVYNSDEENCSSSANSIASAGGAFDAAAPPAAEDISRQAHVLQELSRKVINMEELRKLASQGLPDGAGIRSTVWKLLLGYLPTDRSLWPSELAKKRSQYKHFKDELLMNPSEITRRLEKASLENHELDDGSQGFLSRSEISHGEHPLSLGKSSVWNQFFQDTEITEQIDRDVMRTHPDIHFFSGDSALAKSNQEALKNILIVYAKLNPGIRYVQGMNEILAPLFYIFKNDPIEENAQGLQECNVYVKHLCDYSVAKVCVITFPISKFLKAVRMLMASYYGVRTDFRSTARARVQVDVSLGGTVLDCGRNTMSYFFLLRVLQASAEADTFFCFVELLSGFRDNFVQQLDNSVVGIRATITRLSMLLKEHDEELWRHLEMTTKVNPQFYAFRWITLLLTQEFNFADSLIIWDTLLSDPDGPQETLLRVCCAMLVIVRKRLLAGDFTSNLKLLQNYPPTNISHLLYVANKLRLR
ncbi:tbc1 domain family member 13 [Phtheirospermum japonicum]|uniref:Tbc1 domain family member 13 n=1 Tax=Phtheirospermum japonicum TaxID=374723 RepID=A0A830CZY2_9LAMI|nr:tbc1 domain family member 13 [Phtheirospermum japonicum]